MSQAWHTAALYRVKEMPKLSELVGPPRSPTQTIEEMRNIAMMWTQMLGGKVIRREAA